MSDSKPLAWRLEWRRKWWDGESWRHEETTDDEEHAQKWVDNSPRRTASRAVPLYPEEGLP